VYNELVVDLPGVIYLHETGFNGVVYIDVVILVNFIMDYLILWVSGKLSSLRIIKLRLMAAAGLGALYSLVVFLPEKSVFATLSAKILCSVMMLILGYAPVALSKFLRLLCFLYLTTFAMGGAVIGAIYLFTRTPGYIQVWNGAAILSNTFNYYWLVFGIVTAFFLGNGGPAWIRKKWLENNFTRNLVIGIDGREISLEAYLDTGNQLKDPLTRKPVIVLEAQVLKGFVPEEFLQAVVNKKETELASLGNLLDKEWVKRLRLINFTSVGKKQGLIVGLRVDFVEVRTKNEIIRADDTIIGLVDGILSRREKYKALLPLQLLQEYTYKEELYAASRKDCGSKL
jgi:stage II sporulation protein GA (sporulation sigma-E factor processing peptidase)